MLFLYRGCRVSRLPRKKTKRRQIPEIIRSHSEVLYSDPLNDQKSWSLRWPIPSVPNTVGITIATLTLIKCLHEKSTHLLLNINQVLT